jgi:hypothetical protein
VVSADVDIPVEESHSDADSEGPAIAQRTRSKRGSIATEKKETYRTPQVSRSKTSVAPRRSERVAASRRVTAISANGTIGGTFELEHGEEVVDAVSPDAKIVNNMFIFNMIGETRRTLFPKRPDDAISRPDGAQWQAAMDLELGSILTKGTLADDVRLPTDTKPLRLMWVFTQKFNDDGTINRYKARLVVLGNMQVHGVDYFDTYAPVVMTATYRLLFSAVVARNMHCHQMDALIAFLNAKLDERLFVRLDDATTTMVQRLTSTL